MSRKDPAVELTDAEWKVMQALWRKSPASARDVLETLEGETDWAYTTVKTLLARLAEKGAVRLRLRANTNLYEPAVAESAARRTEVKALVDRAFAGSFAPLLAFVLAEEKLSEKDKAELRAILAKGGGRAGDG